MGRLNFIHLSHAIFTFGTSSLYFIFLSSISTSSCGRGNFPSRHDSLIAHLHLDVNESTKVIIIARSQVMSRAKATTQP